MIVVVCDDARTAVSYFTELKRLVKQSLTLTVVRNPSDRASPANVVHDARVRLSSLARDRARDVSDRTSVWALIDLEQAAARRKEAEQAKQAAEQVGVSVALSDPCYEVWTLLHLIDTGGKFADCRAVMRRLGTNWRAQFNQKFGKKAQADYAKIIGNRAVAVARAKRHREAHDPSWTEVYRLIEEIDHLSAPE